MGITDSPRNVESLELVPVRPRNHLLRSCNRDLPAPPQNRCSSSYVDCNTLHLSSRSGISLRQRYCCRRCARDNCGCSLSADSGDREGIRPAVANLGTTSGSVLLRSVFHELRTLSV